MPPKRMTANPARPARHRPGKSGGRESSSDSDSSDAEEEPAAPAVAPPPKAASAGKIISNLSKVDLNARRKEAEEAEEKRRTAERLAAEEGFVTEEEEESASEEEESGSEDEESSSSEEEAPRRLMMRPKFVPKSQRGKETTEKPDEDEEAARKKAAADELVEEQIAKDLAARAVGKKHWDDDENEDSDVDTTDGLDPAAEEAAWRVRELKRLKRARETIEERERQLAEVERRRNLTEEERQAEDEAHLARQKEDKDSRGKMGFMQKYFHTGAFFQEEAEAAGLLQRDIMGTRIADDVRNREALPEYLQKRDMTRLGRKGGTKYRDMRSEDTGRWGDLDDRRGGGDSKRRYDGDDDRFRPDDDGPRGANALPLGDRRTQPDDRSRRKRSTSPNGHDGDKRRKVD